MGYRSDWRIFFNTAGRANDVMAWLKQEAQANHVYSSLLQEMLDDALRAQTADVIELEDDSWKLGDWDSLTCAIHDKWDDDPEVDFAYARIGEELEDVEMHNGDYTYLYVCRSLSDTDCAAVPKAERQTVDAEPEHRPPLKCTCGGFGACSDWCDLVTGEYSEGAY